MLLLIKHLLGLIHIASKSLQGGYAECSWQQLCFHGDCLGYIIGGKIGDSTFPNPPKTIPTLPPWSWTEYVNEGGCQMIGNNNHCIDNRKLSQWERIKRRTNYCVMPLKQRKVYARYMNQFYKNGFHTMPKEGSMWSKISCHMYDH